MCASGSQGLTDNAIGCVIVHAHMLIHSSHNMKLLAPNYRSDRIGKLASTNEKIMHVHCVISLGLYAELKNAMGTAATCPSCLLTADSSARLQMLPNDLQGCCGIPLVPKKKWRTFSALHMPKCIEH